MSVAELVDLLQRQPPGATVRVVGEAVCDHDDHVDPGYVTVQVEMDVVHVRSTHPKVVQVEVRE